MLSKDLSFQAYTRERKKVQVNEEELRERIERSGYGPKSKQLLLKWLEVESTGEPGFAVFNCPPLVDSGSGAVIYDADGREYIDCLAGFSASNIGLCHPEVVDALTEQAKKLIHYYDFPSRPRIALSEKLIAITPGDFPKKVIYGTTGSEAVETAIQLARWYTGKAFVLVAYGAYHGRTPGTMGLTGKATMWFYYHPVTPADNAIAYFNYPYCYRCPYDKTYPQCHFFCLKSLEYQFQNRNAPFMDVGKGVSNTAAILIEPMQGSSGYIIPPAEYLSKLRELCNQYGILLMVDEIQTGMARSGRMWACEHSGVAPDLMIFGKGVGGGLPISGVVGRKEIMDSWGPAAHLGTFCGTSLSSAVANRVIDVMQRDNFPEKAEQIGRHFVEGLVQLANKHPIVGNVKGRGLFIGIEFVRDRKTKEPAAEESSFMIEECLKEGLICQLSGYFGNRFSLIPPLVISRQQVNKVLDILDKVFTRTEQRYRLG